MKQIELDRKNCEINACFENRRTVIKAKEIEQQKMIEEIKLEAEKKICECKKRLQELSLEYQELKAETANLRESLLIQAINEKDKDEKIMEA